MKLKLDLRFKLALAFVLVISLSLGATAVIGYVTTQSLARDLTLREILSTAGLANELVHHYVDHAGEMMVQAARRSSLLSAVEAGRWEELNVILEDIQKETVVFEAVWIVDLKGVRRATSWPDKGEIGIDLSDRDYFRGALGTGQPYISVPYASSRTRQPMAGIAVPIRDAQGRMLAILVGGLPLAKVGDVIADIRVGQHGHAFLMDSAGVIVAHPEGLYSLESLKGMQPLVDTALASGETGTTQTVNLHGEPALAGWVTVAELDWKVVIEVPVAEASATVAPLISTMVPVALLSIVGGLVAGLFLAAWLARPVRQAMEAARAVAAGDYSQRVPVTSEDEIGELATAFNTMAARVGELTGQLQATIAELLTPAIPLHEGLLAMPLVGAIDTVRARQITETLLGEIVRQRARTVILDISGVPAVDTAVVKHLSETIAAARLLGVRVIVSGISPRVAQTLVELGVDWGDVLTVHNMGQAMEAAGVKREARSVKRE